MIIRRIRSLELRLSSPLIGVAGEVVNGLLDGGYAFIEGGVAAVLSTMDSVGPPLWNMKLHDKCQ
jgi:hypothetical protein